MTIRPGLAQDAARSETLRAEGMRLHNENRYQEAALLLGRAYLLSSDPDVLLVLGNSYRMAYSTKCLPEAKEAATWLYRRYLSEAEDPGRCGAGSTAQGWLLNCSSVRNFLKDLECELTEKCKDHTTVEVARGDVFIHAMALDLRGRRQDAMVAYQEFLRQMKCVSLEQASPQESTAERLAQCQDARLFMAFLEAGVSAGDGASRKTLEPMARITARKSAELDAKDAKLLAMQQAGAVPPAPIEPPAAPPQAPKINEEMERLRQAARQAERDRQAAEDRARMAEERAKKESTRAAKAQDRREEQQRKESERQARLEEARQKLAREEAERTARERKEAERQARKEDEEREQARLYPGRGMRRAGLGIGITGLGLAATGLVLVLAATNGGQTLSDMNRESTPLESGGFVIAGAGALAASVGFLIWTAGRRVDAAAAARRSTTQRLLPVPMLRPGLAGLALSSTF